MNHNPDRIRDKSLPHMKDALNRKLPPLGARNSIYAIFAYLEQPSPAVAYFNTVLAPNLEANRERWAEEDAESERIEASRNASRADVATHPIGDE
jgi:hypothetical protein